MTDTKEQVRHDPTSQVGRLLKRFKRDGRITNIQMVKEMFILRGSERVRELVKEGHNIRSIQLNRTTWVYVYEGEE
ncbi:helix-turn-helix domain-containing protein [Rhodococcus sp. IEGM 1374]|uniref:helix-turn-helix domain-containing protein n=1 Tax=Rhodococcus sp. IEGM 1374 TaxID=3082221 RepID=UPI003989CAE7